jgi:hypothetical protein
MDLWDLTSLTSLGCRPCPISPGQTTLTWLGYASNGILCSSDSEGIVRALIPEWNYRWSPIADLDKQAGDNEKFGVIGEHSVITTH